MQFLMQQVFQSKQSDESAEKLASKVKSLEKDLFYYRKTSRDLRKKMGMASIAGAGGGGDITALAVEGVRIAAAEERVSSAPELDESGRTQGNRQKRKHRRIPSGRSTTSIVGAREQGGNKEESASFPAQLQKTSLSDRTFTSSSHSAQKTGIDEAASILKMGSSRPQLSAHHVMRPAQADAHQEPQPHVVVTKSKRELHQLR